jgi:hypothetical protein
MEYYQEVASKVQEYLFKSKWSDKFLGIKYIPDYVDPNDWSVNDMKQGIELPAIMYHRFIIYVVSPSRLLIRYWSIFPEEELKLLVSGLSMLFDTVEVKLLTSKK